MQRGLSGGGELEVDELGILMLVLGTVSLGSTEPDYPDYGLAVCCLVCRCLGNL